MYNIPYMHARKLNNVGQHWIYWLQMQPYDVLFEKVIHLQPHWNDKRDGLVSRLCNWLCYRAQFSELIVLSWIWKRFQAIQIYVHDNAPSNHDRPNMLLQTIILVFTFCCQYNTKIDKKWLKRNFKIKKIIKKPCIIL